MSRRGRRPRQPPTTAAARHAAAPRPRAYRGLARSDSPPTTGEPIAVLPTRAVDHRAVTRPRYSGSEASWIVALPVVRKITLATPTSTHAAIAVASVGAAATRPTAIA